MSTTRRPVTITPRNENQSEFIEAIKHNTVVFSIGPAGTGKTYLSVACAVRSLREKEVSRIVITRPAVEAGEKLGFLPGDLQAKLDPYLRPLFDAFRVHMSPEELMSLIENGTIEICPLAFMRGRTLQDCFIILDEAQNTTPTQMKMFLTRLGAKSKMIVNGDVTQIDLPGGYYRSGLAEIDTVLYEDIPGVAWIEFDRSDIVRHPVVKAIVFAYERFEKNKEKERELDSLISEVVLNGSHPQE